MVFGGVDFCYVMVFGWFIVGEGASDEMEGVINGKVLVFGGVEVQLPIFGPAGAAVLENVMAVSGGDEFNVICIEEAVC